MNKTQKIILISSLAFIFILVYSPHMDYRFPYHIDEWHHITQSIRLEQGNHSGGIVGTEIGFHYFLSFLNKFTNLVLIYKFLPAFWAVLSALTIFFVVYKKTDKFYLAILTVLFFASIKSNVNTMGFWFFTPLTFCVPLIFLYFYFFTEGLKKSENKFILTSLGIMLLIIFIHAPSLLFLIPSLIIFSIFYKNKIKSNWRIFFLFLIIPLIGIIFYKQSFNLTLSEIFPHLFSELTFQKGWGVVEVTDNLSSMYPLTGYLLAISGYILLFLKKPKKYLEFLIWPLPILLNILIFKFFEVSFLVPYQRNLFYLILILPFLSAIFLYYLMEKISIKIKNSGISETEIITKLTFTIILLLTIFLSFYSYNKIPTQFELYEVIDEKDYEDLLFIKNLPGNKIMADPFFSTAVFPISRKIPIATIRFYGNREISERFFFSNNCEEKTQILKEQKVSYIVSKEQINCGWDLISSKNNFIYKYDIDNISLPE